MWAFFMAKPKPLLEVKMAIASKGDRRKGIRRQGGRRKGDIEKIKDKVQEVTALKEAVSPEKTSSVWSWHEEFTTAWCETFITKKRKRNPER